MAFILRNDNLPGVFPGQLLCLISHGYNAPTPSTLHYYKKEVCCKFMGLIDIILIVVGVLLGIALLLSVAYMVSGTFSPFLYYIF